MMAKTVEVSNLQWILKEFPKSMKFCFAYGSGAFSQLNHQGKKMLDLIFVVHNPNQWHNENLARNPKHYAWTLKFLGHKAISHVQENWGANIYYNTLITMPNQQKIKYGVISDAALVEDLLDWNNLYLAGRLHKPIKVLVEPEEDSQLRTALVQNLHSAVHAALLLLPEHFTETDFYKTITRLSYSGDFRMLFGENKNKVENIVFPQLGLFRQLYGPILKHFEGYVEIPKSEQEAISCHQDTSSAAKIYHLNHLPRRPQVKLVKVWSQGPRLKDTEDCLRAIANDPECSEILERCIKEIVWQSSVTQSLKGILTAGVLKSFKYSGAKIMKMVQSNQLQTGKIEQDSSETKKISDLGKKISETKNIEKPKE
ncbi:phosphatidate cytidylyltransferase, mitochondrial [Prorops nasuta]|uniref:phosphatidate cytidylyltransferase, mitochondrial n=1 Tax=Prorops nasuta TaxID=863751 RepID=UPI0034CEA381